MIGLGIGVAWKNNNISSGGSGFDTDYQAVLNRATTLGYTLPSAPQQILQNQLVLDLKAGGIWDKLDTFALFATNGSNAKCLARLIARAKCRCWLSVKPVFLRGSICP